MKNTWEMFLYRRASLKILSLARETKNTGELDMYFIENNHEPIINREIFKKVNIRKVGKP